MDSLCEIIHRTCDSNSIIVMIAGGAMFIMDSLCEIIHRTCDSNSIIVMIAGGQCLSWTAFVKLYIEHVTLIVL